MDPDDTLEPTDFTAEELVDAGLYLDDEGSPRCKQCHEWWDACDCSLGAKVCTNWSS